MGVVQSDISSFTRSAPIIPHNREADTAFILAIAVCPSYSASHLAIILMQIAVPLEPENTEGTRLFCYGFGHKLFSEIRRNHLRLSALSLELKVNFIN